MWCPREAIWWFAEAQQQVGPMRLIDLGAEMAAGRVGDRTLAWRKGMTDWAIAGSIADLAQQGRARYDGANLGKGAPS
ncbi:DUF4339 domain-containing protein [Roseovarius sp. B08]|uniref:DUF4339 domain-containing protein n=1 Tax=Roseovarius sp. B08 TaxID=3449223 RepID=UPI003EDC1BEE